MRSPKKANSSEEIPSSDPNSVLRSVSSVNISGTVVGATFGSLSERRPKRAKIVPVVSTRLSATVRAPRYGIRSIVSMTCL